MTDPPDESEFGFAALLDASKAGDAAARDAVLRRVYPSVEQMVHKRLRTNFVLKNPWLQPMFSTGDIVQEVFLGVLTTAPSFVGMDEDKVLGYLSVTVENRLLDMMRFHGAARRDGRRRVDASELPASASPQSSPRRTAEVNETLAIYLEVLGTFPSPQRELLRRRLEQDQPYDAIAAELGLSSGEAARKQFNDIYAKLLIRLGERGVSSFSRDQAGG